MKNDVAAIILAAGKGERMKSTLPKVLHLVCRRPMVEYVVALAKGVGLKKIVAVLGYKHDEVRKVVDKEAAVALQEKQLGTAHAVMQALPLLKDFTGSVLILYGDIPLLKEETIRQLLDRHRKTKAWATLLTARLDKPFGYGRILRDEYAAICGIVEEKDADDFQKTIKEINTGIICFRKDKLQQALKAVKPNNKKKEFYLTDVIGIFCNEGGLIESVEIGDFNESLGVNSRVELSKANRIMQGRINEALMNKGITIIDPDTAYISYDARIGEDTTIYPFTVIEKNVRIGAHCSIGPFIRLRQGTILKDNVTAGNFLEISRSVLGSKTQAKHFGYIGDSRIGCGVNIGAGTVTANYDGKNKNITFIQDGAFIGSDTVIVAPARIGKAARTGAGSVVTKRTVVKNGSTVAGVPARLLKG